MSEDARSDVEKVLDGEMRYDDLGTEEEQAVVRKVVDERIREDIASLNFEAEFIAQGRAWTDVDADGKPILRAPTESGDIDLPTGELGDLNARVAGHIFEGETATHRRQVTADRANPRGVEVPVFDLGDLAL
ncbi:hypothetical protein GCM10009691_41480 [Brevibacterium picturae]|uniref:Uncharacterized protein n=1 Tax=Brevibacterium picturae TaxID=260553 RepID=A0ABP4NPY1_9MICO